MFIEGVLGLSFTPECCDREYIEDPLLMERISQSRAPKGEGLCDAEDVSDVWSVWFERGGLPNSVGLGMTDAILLGF